MELSIDEQRLLAEFRRLTPLGRDELLACAASLLRKSAAVELREGDRATNQCRLKSVEPRPEAEKTPIFTE